MNPTNSLRKPNSDEPSIFLKLGMTCWYRPESKYCNIERRHGGSSKTLQGKWVCHFPEVLSSMRHWRGARHMCVVSHMYREEAVRPGEAHHHCREARWDPVPQYWGVQPCPRILWGAEPLRASTYVAFTWLLGPWSLNVCTCMHAFALHV